MFEKEDGALRAVAWSEVCPWLAIFRTFRLAVGFRVLLLGAVATLLTALVWGFFGLVFSLPPEQAEANLSPSAGGTRVAYSPATLWTKQYAGDPWRAVTDELVPDAPQLPGVPRARELESLESSLAKPATWQPGDPVFGPWSQLSRPLWEIFHWRATLRDLACLLLCGLSSLAVWAFFGGAITRIAAVQLASDERIGWMTALRFACRKWPSYFAAPLFPLLGIALAAVPVVVLGLVMKANMGAFLVGLVWLPALVLGFVMALLLLGLVFGWPLMFPTISAEGTDSFDALSRSYAYVYQRPLHYLFYAVVAAGFGALGWLLVKNFAAGVVALSYWAASWGSGAERMADLMAAGTPLAGIAGAGAVLIHVWAGCVKLLAVGFLYGYFWTAATVIYYLLRRDVDATEMDEVFLDAEESERSAALPPLKTEEADTPAVAEQPPQPAPERSPEPDSGPQANP